MLKSLQTTLLVALASSLRESLPALRANVAQLEKEANTPELLAQAAQAQAHVETVRNALGHFDAFQAAPAAGPHTKGPWDVAGARVGTFEDSIIAEFFGKHPYENARRVAACIAFCEELPTKQLEVAKPLFDTLLAADNFMSGFEDDTDGGNDEIVGPVLADIRALIGEPTGDADDVTAKQGRAQACVRACEGIPDELLKGLGKGSLSYAYAACATIVDGIGPKSLFADEIDSLDAWQAARDAALDLGKVRAWDEAPGLVKAA